MAFIQKLTPPPNKVLEFSLRNFAGGLNNRSEQLQVNEASDLLNMAFVDETIMQKRNGTKYFDELNLTEPITFIDEFKPYQDEDKLIRATDSVLYVGNTKLCDVAGRVSGVNFLGMYYFADGEKIRVYGKFPQEDRTATNDYYGVDVIGTAVNDYVVMEMVNPPSDYTPLDAENYIEGMLKVDYTNKKIWYEPCAKEKSDTFLGANVLPEKAKYIVVHGGRLFVSGNDKDDDNIFITQIDHPWYFPVTLPIQIPPDSDKVTGLIVYDDSVLVGRQHDLHVLLGTTNNYNIGLEIFRLKKINAHTGFANGGAFDSAHNYLFFVGTDGNMYSLSSTRNDEKILSTTIISKTLDIERYPISLTLDDVKNASTIFFKDEWYVSMKNIVLVYSYRHRAWTLYNNLNARAFYNLEYILICGNDKGRTVEFSEDYYDLGLPFQAYWVSKWFDMDEANTFKQFREFFLVAHTFPEYNSDIDVTFEIDYAEVKDRHTIKNQIAVFGKARWGDRFINKTIVNSLPIIIGQRARQIKFKFSNGYFHSGEVATYSELADYQGKENGLLVKVLDEGKYYLYYEQEWIPMDESALNQTMKIYQVNGSYELRGKR